MWKLLEKDGRRAISMTLLINSWESLIWDQYPSNKTWNWNLVNFCNFETKNLWIQETLKPENIETKKPWNHATLKLRSQETNKLRNQESNYPPHAPSINHNKKQKRASRKRTNNDWIMLNQPFIIRSLNQWCSIWTPMDPRWLPWFDLLPVQNGRELLRPLT